MSPMLIKIHDEMTREALSDQFSPHALEVIVAANLNQDALHGQFGHDEFHYDNNAIEKGDRYIIEQRGYVLTALLSPASDSASIFAWAAFGRLLHAAQDFYSHTNYVTLWLNQFSGSPPSPPEIDPLQKDLIENPSLHSGKIHFPMDVLYFIPFMRPMTLKLLPPNSHGRMNLDSPAQGPHYDYARAAAVKRTHYEFDLLQKLLPPEMFARFVDRDTNQNIR